MRGRSCGMRQLRRVSLERIDLACLNVSLGGLYERELCRDSLEPPVAPALQLLELVIPRSVPPQIVIDPGPRGLQSSPLLVPACDV